MSEESWLTIVRLGGELEIGRRDEIRDALQIRSGSEAAVLVDCSGATYADSTTLAELLRFRLEAESRRVPIAVLIGTPQFERIIQYAGLKEAFSIFKDRASALSYLAGRHAR